MEEVQVHIELASDGSGWSLSGSHDTRTAYVYKSAEETTMHNGYMLIVPLEGEEDEVWDRNVIENEGIEGLKIPNVSEQYIEF